MVLLVNYLSIAGHLAVDHLVKFFSVLFERGQTVGQTA